MPITHKALHVLALAKNMYKTHENSQCIKNPVLTRVHRPTSWHALPIQPISHAFSKSMERLFIDQQARWLATGNIYDLEHEIKCQLFRHKYG